MMKRKEAGFTEAFLAEAQRSLGKHHLPRIVNCLEILSDEQIWWRPNAASNSIGNIVLHLCGNVRQWIIAGLGAVSLWEGCKRRFGKPAGLSAD